MNHRRCLSAQRTDDVVQTSKVLKEIPFCWRRSISGASPVIRARAGEDRDEMLRPGPAAGHTVEMRRPKDKQPANKGLFDEYKDLRIEENPAEDKLITVE
jgi:hypothetical protein